MRKTIALREGSVIGYHLNQDAICNLYLLEKGKKSVFYNGVSMDMLSILGKFPFPQVAGQYKTDSVAFVVCVCVHVGAHLCFWVFALFIL